MSHVAPFVDHGPFVQSVAAQHGASGCGGLQQLCDPRGAGAASFGDFIGWKSDPLVAADEIFSIQKRFCVLQPSVDTGRPPTKVGGSEAIVLEEKILNRMFFSTIAPGDVCLKDRC